MCSQAPVYGRCLPVHETRPVRCRSRVCCADRDTRDAGPADDLEIGNLRQLGQKVVLDTVGKGGVFSVVT